MGGQFSKFSLSSWASFLQHCLTQYLPPFFRKLNHKLNNSREREKLESRVKGEEICSLLVKFPPEIHVLKAHKSHGPQLSSRPQTLGGNHTPLYTARAAQLWNWAYKDVCGPFLPPVCFMHVWGPWRSLCRHWVLCRVLGCVFILIFFLKKNIFFSFFLLITFIYSLFP